GGVSAPRGRRWIRGGLAQPEGDPAIDVSLADMDVRLGDVAFQTLETQLIRDGARSFVDVEREVSDGPGDNDGDLFEAFQMDLDVVVTLALAFVVRGGDRVRPE